MSEEKKPAPEAGTEVGSGEPQTSSMHHIISDGWSRTQTGGTQGDETQSLDSAAGKKKQTESQENSSILDNLPKRD